MRDASSMAEPSTAAGGVGSTAGTGRPPSDQETSAGRISVATPAPERAAATASAASAATAAADSLRRTQPETDQATASMSDSRGASSALWSRAWSPTTLTTGVRARRALCRLASPLPSPGPRCRSVTAGRPAIRAYPSAAPVTTPSNSPSTPRISGTSSSAATKCISEVPGLAKHMSTPESTSVRSSACAPFIPVCRSCRIPAHPGLLYSRVEPSSRTWARVRGRTGHVNLAAIPPDSSRCGRGRGCP